MTLRPRDELRAALDRMLPGLPWSFAEPQDGSDWSHVEAMLVGSLVREAEGFDPRATPGLRFVQRIYTGLDGFPFAKFPPAVQIAGNVGAFGPYVAEHALALGLAAARDLHRAEAAIRAGRLRPAPQARLFFEARAVVLGYGEIGRAIAQRLAGFGTHVVGLNRSGTPAPGCERMYASSQLREALSDGDIVFEARPLTKLTQRSIGAVELGAMRPQAILVNVGRAGTVDEEALYRHLQGHPEFRAAFDVWWNEDYATGTLATRFPFGELPNFSGTPHAASGNAGDPQVEARALRLAVENVQRFFLDGRPAHVADRREYED